MKFLQRVKYILGSKLELSRLKFHSESHFQFFAAREQDNDFARLCDKYGSDKGSRLSQRNTYAWEPQDFATFYNLIFSNRTNFRHVLECGIGTNNPDLASSMGPGGIPGASLRVWKDFFPEAEIVGIDIDADILFTEDRIRTFQVDQTSKESLEKLSPHLDGITFDLIVDDGLHVLSAAKSLFMFMWKYLAPGGYYLIEDVHTLNLREYVDFFEKYSSSISVISFSKPNNFSQDNNLILMLK